MNMRYGSSLNPKCMVDALWRKRKVIFFAISVVSLAGNAVVLVGNAVVLAESLGIHKTLTSLVSLLLLQLRDAGELLVQRPVLYMLLNLIMLRMVVKSGMLGGRASTKPVVHEAENERLVDKSAPIFENFDDHSQAPEQSLITSASMKRRSSAVLFSYTEPALNSNVSFEQGLAGKTTKNRATRASLFTIEPLNFIKEPLSNTLLSSSQIVGTAQLDIGNPMSLDTAPPNTLVEHSTKEPVSHKNPKNEVSPFLLNNCAPDHPIDSGRQDDYDLNRQEFNERVETFITKFKRNLTMQRQDSFNRLLGLVGVGVKR